MRLEVVLLLGAFALVSAYYIQDEDAGENPERSLAEAEGMLLRERRDARKFRKKDENRVNKVKKAQKDASDKPKELKEGKKERKKAEKDAGKPKRKGSKKGE